MDLIYITNDAFRARIAQRSGVDRVMVDLEINGKCERQGHLNTVISRHTIDDVATIRGALDTTQLMVRVNPLHQGSKDEISQCVRLGVDVVMLPMFSTADEVGKFIDLVAGRAKTCLLLETGQALARINNILSVDGIDEIHIGLNDLHLSLKLDFMFELLSGGLVDYLASAIRARKIKFGFGGVARLGRGPLSSNLILSEHVRLGSSQVLLSRDFSQVFDNDSAHTGADQFYEEVRLLRQFIDGLAAASAMELAANSIKLRNIVHMIVNKDNR